MGWNDIGDGRPLVGVDWVAPLRRRNRLARTRQGIAFRKPCRFDRAREVDKVLREVFDRAFNIQHAREARAEPLAATKRLMES